MTVYCCFLRGINVGGRNRIKMADLRGALADAGLAEVRTLLQSGNVVLRSDGDDPVTVAAAVRSAAQTAAGVDCRVMVRDLAEMQDLLGRNPFPDAAADDPKRLLVMFLEDSAPKAGAETLRNAHRGPEEISVSGSEAFIHYREGIGRSKLTPAVLERHLGPGTARNWQTVSKVMDLAGLPDG